ncbi:MAG: hypothetical protein DMG06_12680 [Acidobacteria bacterium]|nr:MAG: hypothetical protein DMG06_12680 [Acidobacteriota bacterium]
MSWQVLEARATTAKRALADIIVAGSFDCRPNKSVAALRPAQRASTIATQSPTTKGANVPVLYKGRC